VVPEVDVIYPSQSIAGQRELRGIASDPDDRNVMNVASFETLLNMTEAVVMAVCNSEFHLPGFEI
jgi:hypothetical protein